MKFKFETVEDILTEMARIGIIDDYELYVRSKDGGNVPHIHIWDAETNGDKFHSCVRLDAPEYFHHTGKEDVLNHKMKKELIDFFNAPYRKYNITNWQHAVDLWNDNTSDIIIPEGYEMPDYNKL